MTEPTNDRALAVLLPRDLPPAEVLPFAQRAEKLGFDELWVVEDLGFRGGIAQAAAVLAVTSTIRVGVGIMPVAARNVAFAAMEIATLTELFPGRIDAGIGHGMPGWIKNIGVWPESPLTLLREYTEALRGLLRGDRLEVNGRYVTLSGVRLERPPSQVPPVLAGVRGPKSLAVAGRCADGTILAEPSAPEYIRAAIEHIGATGPRRLVVFAVAAVNDDAAAARNLVRPDLAWIGDADWAPHLAPMPFADDFARLRRRSATRAAFVRDLPATWIDDLAVVGTPDQAGKRLEQLYAAGATDVVLIPAGSRRLEALTRLARLRRR